MAIPFLYFGVQLLAAPFFPNFSILRNVASDLGSAASSLPVIFNSGSIALGLVGLGAIYGFARVLWPSVHPLLVVLVGAVLVNLGLGSFWAGIYPLPSPQHGANPFATGLILTPLILTICLWKPSSQPLRLYWVVNLMLFGLMAAVYSGLIPLDRSAYEGLMQRILALTVFVPIGVMAYFLRRIL